MTCQPRVPRTLFCAWAFVAGSALAQISGPTILEFPEPLANHITVQAIVQTGSLNARDRALARILGDTILSATQDFNRDTILEYSTLAGYRMKCTVSADHFRIQLEVPKGQMKLGAQIMSDVLRHARFEEDT